LTFLGYGALVIRNFGISETIIVPIVSECILILKHEISFICLSYKAVMYVSQY